MKLGGFSPLPWKLGGGPNHLESIYRALCDAMGTAYDVSDSSNVVAEIMGEARTIEAVWSANRRLANQWDPLRMTDFLPRWEAILDLHPGPNDSLHDRRLAVRAKFLAWVGPSSLDDVVHAILGVSFVGIVYTDLADAHMMWSETGFPNDWVSTTAHILVRVQFAPNQTQAEFWALMAKLGQALDDLLPAYCDWDWGTYDEAGVEGFYLDEPVGAGPPPANLNFETFDS